MAVVIVALGDVVGYVAMPALAGLLMLIGYRTIKPANLQSVWRTGAVQKTVLVVTFVLTMMIPLQYAVLVGVGLSVDPARRPTVEPDHRQASDSSTPTGISSSPTHRPSFLAARWSCCSRTAVSSSPQRRSSRAFSRRSRTTSRHSVVILRLRGRSDLGSTALDVLHRYAAALAEVDSRLVLVSTNERIDRQLTISGIADRHRPGMDLPRRRTGRCDPAARRGRGHRLGRRPSRRDGDQPLGRLATNSTHASDRHAGVKGRTTASPTGRRCRTGDGRLRRCSRCVISTLGTHPTDHDQQQGHDHGAADGHGDQHAG